MDFLKFSNVIVFSDGEDIVTVFALTAIVNAKFLVTYKI